MSALGRRVQRISEKEERDLEIIFETYLFKATNDTRAKTAISRHSWSLTGPWKKKYFVLIRNGNVPQLWYYDKKPQKSSTQSPDGVIELSLRYRVSVVGPYRGKNLVCQLTLPHPSTLRDNGRSSVPLPTKKSERNILLATDKIHIHQLLLFFLRTQVALREELVDDCFVVRPDNSEDQRRIGSRGSMCLLHVSQWGVTVCLQLSNSVLAQWPLRCIKSYECTGRGRLTLDVGSQAETGAGRFVFNTRQRMDLNIYEAIDNAVNKLASWQSMVSSSRLSAGLDGESLVDDYNHLQDLTVVQSSPAFVAHVRKISRDIYDHLAEHLGGASVAFTRSSTDLLEDTTSVRIHSQPISVPNLSRMPAHSRSSGQSALSIPSNDAPLSLPSQYLHMVTQPPPHILNQRVDTLSNPMATYAQPNSTLPTRGHSAHDGSYSMEANVGAQRTPEQIVRKNKGSGDRNLHVSRSMDNLLGIPGSTYMDMSASNSNIVSRTSAEMRSKRSNGSPALPSGRGGRSPARPINGSPSLPARRPDVVGTPSAASGAGSTSYSLYTEGDKPNPLDSFTYSYATPPDFTHFTRQLSKMSSTGMGEVDSRNNNSMKSNAVNYVNAVQEEADGVRDDTSYEPVGEEDLTSYEPVGDSDITELSNLDLMIPIETSGDAIEGWNAMANRQRGVGNVNRVLGDKNSSSVRSENNGRLEANQGTQSLASQSVLNPGDKLSGSFSTAKVNNSGKPAPNVPNKPAASVKPKFHKMNGNQASTNRISESLDNNNQTTTSALIHAEGGDTGVVDGIKSLSSLKGVQLTDKSRVFRRDLSTTSTGSTSSRNELSSPEPSGSKSPLVMSSSHRN